MRNFTLWATARLEPDGTGQVNLLAGYPYKKDGDGKDVSATALMTLTDEQAAPVLKLLTDQLAAYRDTLEEKALMDAMEALKVAAVNQEV